jgi:hypothetical protein
MTIPSRDVGASRARRNNASTASVQRNVPAMKRVFGLLFVATLLSHSGCSGDPMAAQHSPDDRLTLTPSLYDGTLVRLTVKERRTGKVIDDVKTRDTDSMKWVTGWVDNTSYIFWGSDTGTRWVRHIGASVVEAPVDAAACKRLEQLFERKYNEDRGNCLRY